ncbi:Membrane-associated protein [Monoraphidium neglectum]|uniref:Membrane-associated protein n=1 Tax=Monoraphidium neglectum TaxID=145388 RepID=A0A0D2KRV7_9CHLO|nr:Membrane-associated protein [Monoraphidium neglectum]KIY98303.1 Membrane-associated protein [Monoraphidium neglectum]|eukprot:XP_013897323.1 Membrane-associated protein [Monoraphidium neglectum]
MACTRAARSGAVVVQANLFSRLVRIIKANLDNFTSSFEDPEVMLDRVIDEMNEDLVRMRQATAKVMASERQMTAKYSQAQATADDWLRRAELAVRKGQDDLAREALARRKSADSAATALKGQLDAQRRALEQLTANVRMLEGKVTEARNKRETLKSRAAAAKSSKAVQEMVAGLRLNSTTAFAAFDKMEERVVAMEAEAESVGILATPDSLESKFAALEGSGGVEDELSALKRGLLTPAAESRRGDTAVAQRPLMNDVLQRRAPEALEIDAELEALRKKARM